MMLRICISLCDILSACASRSGYSYIWMKPPSKWCASVWQLLFIFLQCPINTVSLSLNSLISFRLQQLVSVSYSSVLNITCHHKEPCCGARPSKKGLVKQCRKSLALQHERYLYNQSGQYGKCGMLDCQSACPSYWHKSGYVALTRCITTLCFTFSSSNIRLTFQAKKNVRNASTALAQVLHQSHNTHITYAAVEKGMEYKGEQRWALVKWCKR